MFSAGLCGVSPNFAEVNLLAPVCFRWGRGWLRMDWRDALCACRLRTLIAEDDSRTKKHASAFVNNPRSRYSASFLYEEELRKLAEGVCGVLDCRPKGNSPPAQNFVNFAIDTTIDCCSTWRFPVNDAHACVSKDGFWSFTAYIQVLHKNTLSLGVTSIGHCAWACYFAANTHGFVKRISQAELVRNISGTQLLIGSTNNNNNNNNNK